MKKRIISVILFTFIAISYLTYTNKLSAQTLYVSRYFSNTNIAKKAFIKEKPILLWDIHGVLFYKTWLSVITRGLWNIQNKPKFAYQFLQALCSPHFWKTTKHLKNEKCLVTEAYFDAAQDFKHLHKELISLANNIYTPNKPIYKTINILKEEGYSHYLLSNIGPKTLIDLQTTYPQYFNFLEENKNTINPFTPDYLHWTWKPLTSAFNKALDHINKTHKPWTVIFVDDKIENIKKAHEIGINGILFKSVNQLENDINKLLSISENFS